MKEYKVLAASLSAVYKVGRFIVTSKEDACQQARIAYIQSKAGRTLNDVGQFRFFCVDKFMEEVDA